MELPLNLQNWSQKILERVGGLVGYLGSSQLLATVTPATQLVLTQRLCETRYFLLSSSINRSVWGHLTDDHSALATMVIEVDQSLAQPCTHGCAVRISLRDVAIYVGINMYDLFYHTCYFISRVLQIGPVARRFHDWHLQSPSRRARRASPPL